MSLNTYLPGSGVRFAVVFRDINGVTVDPPTVSCTVKLPDGSVTVDNAPVHDGVAGSGAYHSDFLIPFSLAIVGIKSGTSRWRAEGTVTQSAVAEPEFLIQQLDF